MRVCLLLIPLLLVLCLVVPAQTTEAKPANSAPHGSTQGSAQKSASPSQELAAASNEAAGREPQKEQGENALRESPSVKWLARKTGMGVHTAYLLSVLLNFAVVAVAILWVMKLKMPGAFRARTSEIQRAMEEARKASDDANRRLRDIEARLSRMDAEITGMHVAAATEAKAEEERLKQATEDEKKRIIGAAEQEIASAAGSARRELKSFAAELAVSLAEKKIRVDASTDEALVQDFVAQLRNGGKDGR